MLELNHKFSSVVPDSLPGLATLSSGTESVLPRLLLPTTFKARGLLLQESLQYKGIVLQPSELTTAPLQLHEPSLPLEELVLYGRKAQAVESFGQALYWYELAARNFGSWEAVYFQATVYLDIGHPKSSLELLDALPTQLGDTIGQSDVLFSRADALQQLEDFDASQVQRLLNEAISINDFRAMRPADALHELGLLLEASRQPDAAITAFQAALEDDPNRYWIHVDLAQLAWVRRNKEQAIASYSAAMQILPDEPAAFLLLARLYRDTEQFEEAERLYLQVLDKHPANDTALIGLERIRERSE